MRLIQKTTGILCKIQAISRNLPASWLSGVTQYVEAYGVDEDGDEYADLYYSGTPTVTALASTFFHGNTATTAVLGDTFTSSMMAKVIRGSGANVTGIRCEVALQSGVTFLRSAPSVPYKGEAYAKLSATGTVTQSDMDLGANSARTAVVLSVVVGQPIDITVRVKRLQFERGPVVTPLQHNYGPNNVTEPGVDDVWFLLNDGNDALPATLPAGTYGIAWVNPAGGISYATQTLAAEGTIDALRGTRMCDVIIRQGDFTAAEKAIIEAEWSTIAA